MISTPFKKSFKSCKSELSKLRSFVREALDTYGMKKSLIDGFVISIDEACSNIILHGYQDCRDYSFSISLEIADSEIIATIEDDGKPFDPNSSKQDPPLTKLSKYEKGGLGIHIMNKYIDRIEYSIGDGVQPNKLFLFKNLYKDSI
ncbi:MAG: hypothetical protein Kapaf2KO_18340 [Candidatus Kapaibacteriales bacterium]